MFLRITFLIAAVPAVLCAQDPPSIAGRLNYTSGSVSFQPAGVSDWAQASINRPLTVGDQLYADNGARAEVHVPGAAFQLGSQTAFQFLNLDDHNVQVRLSEGTLGIQVRRLEGDQNLEIDTPTLAFSVNRPGEYRIDTNPDTYETRVTAWNGDGEVTANGVAFRVRPGEEAIVTGQEGAQYNVYTAPQYDDFDNWVLSRNRREDRFQSARYVSPRMVGYEDLDEYGSWRSVPEYGEAWVPNNVPAGWAPYHSGSWAWVDPWGWSWVDDQPWGFAPFHYGRWAFAGGSWCWFPGPVAVAPVYAPALVAWVGFGGGLGFSLGLGGGPAVGWFPLSPRDVYIPAYRASPEYVTRINTTNTTVINNTTVTNVYNNYVQTGTVASTANSVNRAVPGAVVAVPQDALASARPVQQARVNVAPSQLASIKSVDPAPRVAPQVASVLGRSTAGAVARPPAAVMNKGVVAKAAPPPPVPSFQQRQALMSQTPGRPIPIQQQQQLGRTAPPATRSPVKVVAQAPQVTPRVNNAPPPPPARPGASVPQRPGNPVPAQSNSRPQQPEAPQQARPQVAPTRPFEPPTAQQRPTPPAPEVPPPNRPPDVQRSQPPATPQQSRPFEPPSVQQRTRPENPAPERQAQPATPARPSPPERPAQSLPQQRPVTPAPPAQEQVRPTPAPPPPHEQARPQTAPPQQRPFEPSPRQAAPPAPPPPREPARSHAAPAPPPREQPRPQAAPPPSRQAPQREEDRPPAPPPPQQHQAQPPSRERTPSRPNNDKDKKAER